MVPLVNNPPNSGPAKDRADITLVTVFRSSDLTVLAIAKSILAAVAIEFIAKGEVVQDLVGWGRFPSGMNLVAGPEEIQVRAEDERDARMLLARLENPNNESGEIDDTGEDNS
jgi:hypothetical protein